MSGQGTPTTRITCTCKICIANAIRLGKSELAAEITVDGISRLAGSGGTLTKQAIHGVVHAANHPKFGKALAKHHTAYWAA